jgi:two-component system cell cycle response regulator DivK
MTGNIMGATTLINRALTPDPVHKGDRVARVLLVEDHEEISDFLSRRLKRRGHDVSLATDGQQAIDMARAEHPDIILLDMNLPIMDGWTAARLIKSSPDSSGTPIIALTAHAMAGDRDKAIAAGCDDYHPKPVDFARLLTQIEHLTGAAATANDN